MTTEEMTQTMIAEIKATIGDYYDASVYPVKGGGASVSITDEESEWTHEWTITPDKNSKIATWVITYTKTSEGWYDDISTVLGQIREALPEEES